MFNRQHESRGNKFQQLEGSSVSIISARERSLQSLVESSETYSPVKSPKIQRHESLFEIQDEIEGSFGCVSVSESKSCVSRHYTTSKSKNSSSDLMNSSASGK